MHQQQRHHRRVRVRPLAMTNIRQRKADPSPSSRGTMYPQEEMIRIVIEQEDDHHNDRVECDDLDLHSYHYTPQPSRMIPDKRYKDYLQGQRSKRKDVSSCPTGPECACHCITFSWIAVAFLLWVGFMIDTQPIFIKGVQPKGAYAVEGVTYKVRTEDQHLPACATAYYTAYAYLLTVFLCFAYRRNYFQILASKFSIRLLRRRNDYCDIPDAKQFDAAASGGLPLFHQSGRRRRHRFGAASAMWNRCFILLRNVWQRWCCGMRFSLTGRDNTKRRRE